MPEAVTLFLDVKLLQLPSHSTGKVITHNSHSASLYHWEWSIIDMTSHQFSTEVRNIMHGLDVPDLKLLLLKATSQRIRYMIHNFVNIWSPEDLSQETKWNKTHVIKMGWRRGVKTCCGKSGGSLVSIQLLNIFHWNFKKYVGDIKPKFEMNNIV